MYFHHTYPSSTRNCLYPSIRGERSSPVMMYTHTRVCNRTNTYKHTHTYTYTQTYREREGRKTAQTRVVHCERSLQGVRRLLVTLNDRKKFFDESVLNLEEAIGTERETAGRVEEERKIRRDMRRDDTPTNVDRSRRQRKKRKNDYILPILESMVV